MTFYWFDYETFGRDPAHDRPAQFAGIRTDESLRIIGDPLVIYCRPAKDYIPDPEACLITGITPQHCLKHGVAEAEFIRSIHQELSVPGSCNAGYNNIRFDDEFTRHTLFRNFFDPYEHEWKNGNSRWDLLDIVRLTRALRPEGINWPHNRDGSINNTLEAVALENNIEHAHAHDALSDVYATIAVARLIKNRKKKLFEYAFSHRTKHNVAQLLNLREKKVAVHVSGMISGEFLHTAAVIPLAKHPTNNNGILVYDLRYDPQPFLNLEPQEMALRLFSPAHELPDDMPRLPVKTIHINRCPVVVPLSTLDVESQERTGISIGQSERHAEILRGQQTFIRNIQNTYKDQSFPDKKDVDASLYSGGFFTPSDRRAFERIRQCPPEKLAGLDLFYDDQRIPEMLLRYRARNYPETLTKDEAEQWESDRIHRLIGDSDRISYFRRKIAGLADDHPQQADILSALRAYADSLLTR